MKSEECSETRAEPPVDKTKVNFCDYFVAAEIPAPAENGGTRQGWTVKSNSTSDARAALDKLFSK